MFFALLAVIYAIVPVQVLVEDVQHVLLPVQDVTVALVVLVAQVTARAVQEDSGACPVGDVLDAQVAEDAGAVMEIASQLAEVTAPLAAARSVIQVVLLFAIQDALLTATLLALQIPGSGYLLKHDRKYEAKAWPFHDYLHNRRL